MTDYQHLLNLAIEAAIRAGQKTLDYYRQEIDILVKDDNSPLTQADLESNRVIGEYLQTTDFPVLSEENQMIPYAIRKNWHIFWLVDPLDGTKEFINKSAEYTINIALIEGGKPILGVVFIPANGILYYGSKDLGSFRVSLINFTTVEKLRNQSIQLPNSRFTHSNCVVVVSKSHLSEATSLYIEKLRAIEGEIELKSFGSSLKLCMIAEGSADIYPRIGPTMEWDTAASHAVAEYAGCKVIDLEMGTSLLYNKENMLNPSFVVYCEKHQELIDKTKSS